MNALTEKRYLTLPEPSAGDTLAARERQISPTATITAKNTINSVSFIAILISPFFCSTNKKPPLSERITEDEFIVVPPLFTA